MKILAAIIIAVALVFSGCQTMQHQAGDYDLVASRCASVIPELRRDASKFIDSFKVMSDTLPPGIGIDSVTATPRLVTHDMIRQWERQWGFRLRANDEITYACRLQILIFTDTSPYIDTDTRWLCAANGFKVRKFELVDACRQALTGGPSNFP